MKYPRKSELDGPEVAMDYIELQHVSPYYSMSCMFYQDMYILLECLNNLINFGVKGVGRSLPFSDQPFVLQCT